MEYILNPHNYSETYLKNLNSCFPNWGNVDRFNWVFSGRSHTKKADIFIFTSDEGEILAGSAVTYRTIRFPDDTMTEIGIMTGSWTLPLARGRGCFSNAIKKSCEIAAQRKVPFLSAFVTASNASFRRLRDAGSYLIETKYLISQTLNTENIDTFETSVKVLPPSGENLIRLYEERKIKLKSTIHFAYQYDEFVTQFIHRIDPIFVLEIGDEHAIIEETESIFQLHYCTMYDLDTIYPILKWANKAGKEVMFFITGNHLPFNSTKFKIVEGYFTLLRNEMVTDKLYEDLAEIHIEYGDKM
jgi:hypothetical protein